jgi:hypothetical protein
MKPGSARFEWGVRRGLAVRGNEVETEWIRRVRLEGKGKMNGKMGNLPQLNEPDWYPGE